MLTEEQRALVTVVLVRARNPNNIGAVARAMHGFGFADLRLVNDYSVGFEKAKSAVDASAILAAAREFPTVADAVADCSLVVGTTAVGERKQEHSLYTLAQAGTLLRSAAATATIATTDTLPLCNFYSRELRPFLQQARAQNPALSNRLKAAGIFEGLRTLLPAALHGTVKNLEDICEEERQLRRQIHYHHWLHGWLMLHVPLSLALLLLGCAHAIMALRY